MDNKQVNLEIEQRCSASYTPLASSSSSKFVYNDEVSNNHNAKDLEKKTEEEEVEEEKMINEKEDNYIDGETMTKAGIGAGVSPKHNSKRWLCVFCLTTGSILVLNIIFTLVSNESLVSQLMSLLQKKNSTNDEC